MIASSLGWIVDRLRAGERALDRARPAWACVGFGLICILLLAPNLHHPQTESFDETHYVRAARALLALSENTNPEHPLLPKQAIAGSIAVFGDRPWAWRAPGLAMGALTVMSVFAIAYGLFHSTATASFAAATALLNNLVYVQARTAMLDAYMAAFALAAAACFVVAARPGPHWRPYVPLLVLAAGVLFGLSVASKWASAPLIAAMLAVFAAVRTGEAIRRRASAATWAFGRAFGVWPGVSLAGALWRIGAASVVAYLLTFWPLLVLESEPRGLWGIVTFQFDMLKLQLAPLGEHDAISYWWEWPAPVRPMFYHFADGEDGRRVVFFVGNMAVVWGGLAAVVACGARGWRRRDWRLAAAAGAFCIAYAQWVLIPKKIAFYFYFFLPAILLSVPLAGAYDAFFRTARRPALVLAPTAYLLIVAAVFVFFFPALAALPIGTGEEWTRWILFRSWLRKGPDGGL